MIKLIISGCNGKMGTVVTRLAREMGDIKIVAGFDIDTTALSGFPVFKNPLDYKEKADVIIDFSHPNMLEGLLNYAKQTKTPAVVATTGLNAKQIASLAKTSSEVALFFSANMSLGINLLIDLVTKAAALLENAYDIEIIEKHHNQKLDAPSGTALAIADAVNDALSLKKEYVYDRHSVRKKRRQGELGIHTIRGGTIVGEHSVIFAGTDEIIELKHSAMSKEIFATGAIAAARFMKEKPPALYSMKDLVASRE